MSVTQMIAGLEPSRRRLLTHADTALSVMRCGCVRAHARAPYCLPALLTATASGPLSGQCHHRIYLFQT